MIFSGPNSLKMALAAGALCVAQSAHATPISSFDILIEDVDFLSGGTIDFSADSFTISNQIGGTGALNTLMGDIDGTFSFTPPFTTIPLGATVGSITSTLGMMEIDDGGGDFLTADLNLDTIGFFDVGLAQFVTLTGSLVFDTYTGLEAELMALAASGASYELSIGFVYDGLTTLANLFADGDGSLTPGPSSGTVILPEPRSLALLGLGILGVGLYGRRRQRHKSDDHQSRMHQNRELSVTTGYGMELTR